MMSSIVVDITACAPTDANWYLGGNVAYIFTPKEYDKQERSMKQSRDTRSPLDAETFCGSDTALLQADNDCHCSVA